MSLGTNIYKLRTAKKLSQEDFAAAMEVSRQSVSKWENDMAVPELEKLIKMAKLFEISLDELVGNAPPQSKPEPVPAAVPASGITTGDLVSILLLILGVLLPFILFFSGLSVLFCIGWMIVPALITWGASFCSPQSRLLLRVYIVYNIIFSILSMFIMYPLGYISVIFSFLVLCYWNSKQEL